MRENPTLSLTSTTTKTLHNGLCAVHERPDTYDYIDHKPQTVGHYNGRLPMCQAIQNPHRIKKRVKAESERGDIARGM